MLRPKQEMTVAWPRVLERTEDSRHLLETELPRTADRMNGGGRELEKVRSQGCLLGFWYQKLSR